MTGGSVPDVPPTTVVAASRTSSRPARGRLRSAASGVGEASRGDQMVGRHRQPAGAHAGGGLDEEAGDAVGAGMAEHVAVPARPGDAGAVARAVLQLAVAPRHPAERRPPGSGRRLGQTGVGRRRCAGSDRAPARARPHRPRPPRPDRRRRVRRGRPGACAPHAGRRRRTCSCRRAPRPSPRRRRRTPARRRRGAPPRRPTSVRRRARPPPRPARRAGRRRPRTRRSSSLVGQCPTGGCVDRSNRPVVGQGPADRLPFRAELGERPERGPRHVGRQVAEQGDGGPQARVTDPPQQRRGIGRQLDEHDRRVELVEGAHDRARRPRSVMAHAEQVQAGRGARGISRGRGRRRRTRPSRHGRAPPPRGIRATRRRRGSGRVRPRRRCRRRCRPATAVRRRSGRRGRGRW